MGCEETGSRMPILCSVETSGKLIGTDNGPNRLVAPEAVIRNPNASSLH